MINDSLPDFGALYTGLSALAGAGRFREALERAAATQPSYPEEQAILMHFQAAMAARLDEPQRALDLLQAALDAGYWYAPVFWESSDFAALRGLEAFQRLRELSNQRRDEARAAARPELGVYLPEQAREPLPLLLALHGNLHNAARELGRWSGMLARGWLVASAQSSQIAGPGRFVWTDRDRAERELIAHYNALRDEYPIEAGHFVVGGFSMGAETALALTLRGVLPADGFIAVAPGGPLLRAPNEIDTLLAGPLPSGLRGAIIIGTRDEMVEEATALARKLESAGVPLRLLVYEGLGHDYPPDFAERLPGLITFLVNG